MNIICSTEHFWVQFRHKSCIKIVNFWIVALSFQVERSTFSYWLRSINPAFVTKKTLLEAMILLIAVADTCWMLLLFWLSLAWGSMIVSGIHSSSPCQWSINPCRKIHCQLHPDLSLSWTELSMILIDLCFNIVWTCSASIRRPAK